jgi:hypothetical protein
MSGHRAWVPPKVHLTTGRLCSAGSSLPGRSPTSPLVCSPPTPSPPSATAPVPLAVASLDADACSVPLEADDTCARRRVVRRRRVTGSPPHRDVSRRGEGLPGYGTVLCVRALGAPPAGYTPRLAQPCLAGDGCCLQGRQDPRHPGSRGVGAAVPWPTRSPASASPHVFPRPAPGVLPARAGSPLAGWDVHPMDVVRSFLVASPPPIPFGPHGLVALDFLSP